jgi:hypothetical protein
MIDRAAFGISLVKIFGYKMREIRKVYLDGEFLCSYYWCMYRNPDSKETCRSYISILYSKYSNGNEFTC